MRHHARMAPALNSANDLRGGSSIMPSNEGFMSAAAAAPLERDFRVMSLIGVAHGTSHYYQLAFVTMLLIVREKAGLSFTDVGALGAIYYAVSGICQTMAGFAVDRFGARPILAAGLALTAIGLALTALADSFLTFAAM
jgi:MFS transporter, FSR family, fosmidomycin resistance protein